MKLDGKKMTNTATVTFLIGEYTTSRCPSRNARRRTSRVQHDPPTLVDAVDNTECVVVHIRFFSVEPLWSCDTTRSCIRRRPLYHWDQPLSAAIHKCLRTHPHDTHRNTVVHSALQAVQYRAIGSPRLAPGGGLVASDPL